MKKKLIILLLLLLTACGGVPPEPTDYQVAINKVDAKYVYLDSTLKILRFEDSDKDATCYVMVGYSAGDIFCIEK